jgi:hypothetical protein
MAGALPGQITQEDDEMTDSFQGYKISVMSDSFLVESFDTLSIAAEREDSPESAARWCACKDEVLARLKKLHQLEVADEHRQEMAARTIADGAVVAKRRLL